MAASCLAGERCGALSLWAPAIVPGARVEFPAGRKLLHFELISASSKLLPFSRKKNSMTCRFFTILLHIGPQNSARHLSTGLAHWGAGLRSGSASKLSGLRERFITWRVRPKLVSDRGPRPERERERRPWSRRGGARCALCTRGHLRRRAGSMRDSTPFRRCSHVANTLHGRRAHRRRRHRPQAALAGRERPH